ncbi:MAG: DUF488 domain-containing protein [Peptostreptococcaceae bacterium]
MLLTFGHSNYRIEYFIDILKKYNIDCLVDIRSISKPMYATEFNKRKISEILKANGIKYIDMTNELGEKRENNNLYTNGVVDFSKLSMDNDFQDGLNRIKLGLTKNYNILLMCVEKNPKDCHRAILISRNLRKITKIKHIINMNDSITQEELDDILILENLSESDKEGLTREEIVDMAYKVTNKKIGYKKYKTLNNR